MLPIKKRVLKIQLMSAKVHVSRETHLWKAVPTTLTARRRDAAFLKVGSWESGKQTMVLISKSPSLPSDTQNSLSLQSLYLTLPNLIYFLTSPIIDFIFIGLTYSLIILSTPEYNFHKRKELFDLFKAASTTFRMYSLRSI